MTPSRIQTVAHLSREGSTCPHHHDCEPLAVRVEASEDSEGNVVFDNSSIEGLGRHGWCPVRYLVERKRELSEAADALADEFFRRRGEEKARAAECVAAVRGVVR